MPEHPTSNVRVHFQAEAWLNDYALAVDGQGDDTWHVTEATADEINDAQDTNSDLDFVRHDDNAPQWVRDWAGPFTITVIENDACLECHGRGGQYIRHRDEWVDCPHCNGRGHL